MLIWGLIAGLALASLLAFVLALALRRESARRAAAEAALAARESAVAERSVRLAMLDRRLAAIAPLDALWAGWTGDCPPPGPLVAAALAALAEARLVFPPAIEADLEEAAAMLRACDRHRLETEAARDSRRRADREDLFEREIALEAALKPTLAGLRRRLADAARIPEA